MTVRCNSGKFIYGDVPHHVYRYDVVAVNQLIAKSDDLTQFRDSCGQLRHHPHELAERFTNDPETALNCALLLNVLFEGLKFDTFDEVLNSDAACATSASRMIWSRFINKFPRSVDRFQQIPVPNRFSLAQIYLPVQHSAQIFQQPEIPLAYSRTEWWLEFNQEVGIAPLQIEVRAARC